MASGRRGLSTKEVDDASKGSMGRRFKGWQMKYGGELSERWKCGTSVERIDDGNDEGD
jgi:hypothetical protein